MEYTTNLVYGRLMKKGAIRIELGNREEIVPLLHFDLGQNPLTGENVQGAFALITTVMIQYTSGRRIPRDPNYSSGRIQGVSLDPQKAAEELIIGRGYPFYINTEYPDHDPLAINPNCLQVPICATFNEILKNKPYIIEYNRGIIDALTGKRTDVPSGYGWLSNIYVTNP